ncbi:MAG: hypothetical protein ABI867_33160 [Kofleriaceae bacterium]
MRIQTLLFTIALAPACVPPGGGSWATWGQPTGGSGTTTTTTPGQPAPPPLPVNLAATSAGKHLQRLTSDANFESEATLSPDGKWLLYTSAVYPEGADQPSARRIMKSRADGKGTVMLTAESGQAHSPAWLPNGTSYVAVSNAMGGMDVVRALKVAPRAASSRILSERDVVDAGGLTVSPDGTRIAFHSNVNGVYTIGVSRVDGSELTHLVPGSCPQWSPDGKRIAFHRSVGDQWQLFVTDADGDELTQLTEGAEDEYPTWSADGKWLAFRSNRGWQRYADATASSGANLYVIRADGTGLVALTQGYRMMLTPRWERDGKIYFSSNDGGTTDIWRIEPDRTVLVAESR